MKFNELIKGVNFGDSNEIMTFSFHKNYGYVYFLLQDGVCVYIGSSDGPNVLNRLRVHSNGPKVFNEVKIIEIKNILRPCVVEHVFIRQAKPKYNKRSTQGAIKSKEDFLKEMAHLFSYTMNYDHNT